MSQGRVCPWAMSVPQASVSQVEQDEIMNI